MEVPRGLVYRPRPSHGVQNGFDGPDQSRVHRTSSSSSSLTYGPPLGDTALYTMDNWMFARDTRESPMDDSVHDLYATAVLSQDTGDTLEGYWFSNSADLRDVVPSHSQIWSPPGVNGFTQGNHTFSASIYQGDTYHPQTSYSPYSAVSTSMARISQVAGQPPLLMRPNEPMGEDFTPGTSSTSSTSSQRFFSPQSRSGRVPMHG